MRNTGWEACLPVHTFNLAALKIAIIMDIFTEVKIHGHDKPQLPYMFSEFSRHEGVNRGASPEWVYNSDFSNRDSSPLWWNKLFEVFSPVDQLKKKEISPYLSCHISSLSLTHTHTHLSSVTIKTLTFIHFTCSIRDLFHVIFLSLCCCLHSVIVKIFLTNLFILFADYFTYLLIAHTFACLFTSLKVQCFNKAYHIPCTNKHFVSCF